jgi:drug/metabolite transporter (DMT)-like permease
MSRVRSHPPLSADEVRGLWLGLIGVLIFSLTLPMTRLAVGSPDAPQLSGWFVAFGRAAVAGILSLFFLAFTRAPRPPHRATGRWSWPSPPERCSAFRCSPRWRCAMWKRCMPA